MKPPPPYEPLLPRESTTVPTGRFRDEFGVESSAPLSREQEVLRDINRGVDVYPELQDIRAVREATTSPKGQGDFQLNQRLQDIVSNQNLSLEDAALEIERARNEARKFEIQRQLDEARLASERGFPTPVQNISGFQQGVMGRPGGIADRRVVRKLPETVPMPEEEINFGGGVVPVQPEGPEIVPEEPAAIPPETKNNRTPERAPLPPMDENQKVLMNLKVNYQLLSVVTSMQ
jgi:hypothetical protein